MKNQTRWWAILSAVLTSFLLADSSYSQEETPTIKLARNEAIGMAIRNNIDLRIRALNSSLAEASVQASKSIYNPNLSASVDYGQTSFAGETYGTETTSGSLGVSQKVSTGGTLSFSARSGPTSAISDPLYDYTDWSSSVGITVYQPLLKNAGKAATELGIAQSRYAYAASLETFRVQLIDTVYSVLTEYNRLYVLYQLLESRQTALLSAQQLLEEIKTRPSADDHSDLELSNTEYALSQRQTELIEAQRQVSSQEAALRYLIGMERKTHVIPVDPPSREEPAETEVQAIALALEHRPDLKELRIRLQSTALREKVSRRNLWPELAVTANGGYRGYEPDGTFGDTLSQIGERRGEYWGAGMRLSFPLGNDLAESTYQSNRIRTEQLKNQIAAAEWKVRDNIQDDNRSLISARLQLRSTAKSKQLAEQRVAQYRKNRRRGSASVKDLLDAENDLIYARNRELNAVENFAYQVASLWKDIGVLLERQNIHIETDRPEQLTGGDIPVILPIWEEIGQADNTVAVDAVTSRPRTGSDHPPSSSPRTISAPTSPRRVAAAKLQSAPEVADKPANPARNSIVPVSRTQASTKRNSYTLQVKGVVASQISAVKRKIARAGLAPVVADGPRQERQVTRLLIGEYQDLATARQALDQLGNSHSGFILKNRSGHYDAFAGSFFARQGAEIEQQRLSARGLDLQLREVAVVLPTFIVTAGSFSSKDLAAEHGRKLEQQGLTVKILQSSN